MKIQIILLCFFSTLILLGGATSDDSVVLKKMFESLEVKKMPHDSWKKINPFKSDPWRKDPILQEKMKEWNGWKVELHDKELIAIRYKKENQEPEVFPKFEFKTPFDERFGFQKRRFKVLKVSDGWIICLSVGEWGSWNAWFSDDGKESYELSSEQIIGFVRYKDRIFLYGSVSYLDPHSGCIFELNKKGLHWNIQQLSYIDQRPLIMIPSEGYMKKICDSYGNNHKRDFLILTRSMIYEYSLSGSIALLYGYQGYGDRSRATWSSHGSAPFRFPNSLVYFQDNIYIGMRYGVIKVSLRNYWDKEEWYVPAPSKKAQQVDEPNP